MVVFIRMIGTLLSSCRSLLSSNASYNLAPFFFLLVWLYSGFEPRTLHISCIVLPTEFSSRDPIIFYYPLNCISSIILNEMSYPCLKKKKMEVNIWKKKSLNIFVNFLPVFQKIMLPHNYVLKSTKICYWIAHKIVLIWNNTQQVYAFKGIG